MENNRRKVLWMIVTVLSFLLVLNRTAALPAGVDYDCNAKENRDQPTTIEIVLSQKWKARSEEVKQALTADSKTVKVRVRIYPFLDPPTNIGIGKCVTAEDARRAIHEAVADYGKLDRVIRQDILPHHWIKIGSTDIAELAWIPITPEDLTRLTDPALSTEQFQNLYRQLATPKERKRPFGMGNEKIEEEPQK
ncbi:MAG: hypothetical protein HY283_07305 [Nitrospirae bacterium]|nr:hypothetical protein [Nitrospirota bacterium]